MEEVLTLIILTHIIFYRAIEFTTGQGAGNPLIGLSGEYKFNNSVNAYGQFIIDEFSIKDVTAGNQSWKNKFGYQFGVKYYNAFKVDNLLLQFEYNQVRLFTNISYRNFDALQETTTTLRSNTIWFTVGLRTNLFIWHIDF